ncbi:MAG TPA: flagellar biosynthetic protein FliQ [Candidatus Angelobacter sp.]|nr:flagellar biosynthetic protein FliQ [Candidatus Angelobacter sp.]
MSTDQVVEIMRKTLEIAVLLGAPMLVIATVVGVLISIFQVVTSLQETTLSTVPRLAAVAAAIFVLMPWMLRRLGMFTIAMFSDFRPYVR